MISALQSCAEQSSSFCVSPLVVQRVTSARVTPLVAFVFSSLFHRADVASYHQEQDLAMRHGVDTPTRGAAVVSILGACYWPSGADQDLTCPTMAEHGRVQVLRSR